MSSNKYAPGDKVFAKLKGFPPWPAKVMERAIKHKDERYLIQYYGTHDESIVKLDQLYKYNEETKAKFGKPLKRKSNFNEALEEIEKDDVTLEPTGGSQPQPPQVTEEVPDPEQKAPNEDETSGKESEGELMIDESPASLPPPPILPIATVTKGKRSRTISKKESGDPASTAASPPHTPSVTVTPDLPGTEVVSRSGRKIKPKRFADEIEATHSGRATKNAEDGPAVAKRAKRGSVSKGAAAAPAKGFDELLVPDGEEKAVTKPVPRGKVAVAATVQQDVPSAPDAPDANGPPHLKAIDKTNPPFQNRPDRSIPSLDPAPGRKSDRVSRSQSTEQNENIITAAVGVDMDESEGDKENSESPPSLDAQYPCISENEEDKYSKTSSNSTEKESGANNETKVRVQGEDGLKVEFSYATNSQSHNERDIKQWQANARLNVNKLVEDFEEGNLESQDILNSAADSIRTSSEERDKLASQLKLLRLEGEVIEIIGEIVGCLGQESADAERALDLLDRLEEHHLSKLMLLKHPEVVFTIQKLRAYVGNSERWHLSKTQKEEFDNYAEEIRKKAVSAFQGFAEIFEASSEHFQEVFQKEVAQFRQKFNLLPMKKILGLTEENGELHELTLGMNGVESNAPEEV